MNVQSEDAYNALIFTHNSICRGQFERVVHTDGRDFTMNMYKCPACGSSANVSLSRARHGRHRDTYTIIWSEKYYELEREAE